MAEMGISVPVSVPITKCVPIPGYVLPGNGQSVSDGNTEGKAQSPKPFYKHPLFLIAAGGAVVYLLVR